MIKAVMFGAGGSGKNILKEVQKKYEIVAFTDNNPAKWGSKIEGIDIYPPQYCLEKIQYDYVIVTSTFGLDVIRKQCMDYGVTEDRIITFYIEAPIESRRIFLKNFSEVAIDYDMSVQCAEAGVYMGDFAKYINLYFPGRKLHLFDTFKGFDRRDIEKEENYSNSQNGDYCNLSIETVLDKMAEKHNCIIHKGYFPETAKGIEGMFLFVNLDMDLYEPTYQGLQFFGKKMVSGGGILVHDYFTEVFKGPRAAVDQYVSENPGIHKLPIGDGISIFLAGF